MKTTPSRPLSILAAISVFLLSGAATAEPIKLRRGIGIHEWLNWSPVDPANPKQYKWPPYQRDKISPRDLTNIKRLGFDFVRLSIDPGPLLAAGSARRPEGIAVLGKAVEMALNADLAVVVDFHPVKQVAAYSDAAIEVGLDQPMAKAYQHMIADAAAMLGRLDQSKVALELMNEPQYYPCDGANGQLWKATQKELVRRARAASKTLTLIATGACGGSAEGLLQISASELADDNILYSFHHYGPLAFTHQATSANMSWVTGIPWPSTSMTSTQLLDRLARQWAKARPDANAPLPKEVTDLVVNYYREVHDLAALRATFRDVVDWAKRNGLASSRLFLGEFGVSAASHLHGGATPSARLDWLTAMRVIAEENGIGWAYWEYSNQYGMSLTTDDWSREADPIAIEALGLKPH